MINACTYSVRSNAPLPGRAQLGNFILEAQIIFSDHTQRQRGQLIWQHTDTRDELQINTRWGQGIARIVLEQGLAQLTTADQQVYQATDIEELTRQAFGFPLPITRLSLWLLAITPPLPEDKNDHLGRPIQRQADGWRIGYTYPDHHAEALPQRLDLQHHTGLSIQLNIEQWYLP